MSRVLVTGGAGFIGSFVVDQLRSAGHEAVIFDVRHSPHHERDEVPTVIGDVLDYDSVREAARGCHAIAHLAAAADVGEVAKEPESAERLNARGTFNVLEAAREEGVSRVIYASTIWVYSEAEGFVDEDVPLHPPAHLYTATKLAGELYCRAYSELFGLDTTILRFGIPYGPRARPAAVVPSFVRRALGGEPLSIAGTGDQTRRFVYVEDLAEGVVRALAPVAANRTYNLVGSEDVSIRQIADTVRSLVGDVEIEHTPGRAGDFNSGAEISGERAARELGWHPETDFREGVSRYIAWQRRQDLVPVRPVREPIAARLRGVGSNAGIAIAAAVAGALAALLSRWDLVTDPVSFLGAVVLLGVPVGLIAGIDWARDRARAGLVILAMLVGVAFQALTPTTRDMLDDVLHHRILLALLVLASVSALAAGRAWRADRARQSDAAG
jgi:UDP-glucose 4-epimerase